MLFTYLTTIKLRRLPLHVWVVWAVVTFQWLGGIGSAANVTTPPELKDDPTWDLPHDPRAYAEAVEAGRRMAMR